MTAELGAVRDLIEAGLNEPADAGRRYGLCAAAPVPDDRSGAMEQPRAGVGHGERLASAAATDAAIDILDASLRPGAWLADGPAPRRTRVVIAAFGTATSPGSPVMRGAILMTYRTALGRARTSR